MDADGVAVRPVLAIRSSAPLERGRHFVIRGVGGRTRISLSDGKKRSYAGTIKISRGATALTITNEVDKRDYVKSVVASETNADFPLEELKAQSILAQTLIARGKPGYWLPDTTERQVYISADVIRPAVTEAVNATCNSLLVYDGQPAAVYFHSTCAGGTSDGEVYFGLHNGAFPDLRGTECAFCRQCPFWRSKRTLVPLKIWRSRIGTRPTRTPASDNRARPLIMEADGKGLSGYEMWMKVNPRLGWDKMPGTRYAIKEVANGQVELSSTGAWHGVGLCQWGASGQARAGKSYLQILDYYFPGTKVQSGQQSRKQGT